MIEADQISEFRALQAEQDEARQPVQITFDAGATVLAASGGEFSDSDHELDEGGFFVTYRATFRVRRALLAAAPAVGQTLAWRRPGESAWRQTLRIGGVADPTNNPVYVLTCEQTTKPR